VVGRHENVAGSSGRPDVSGHLLRLQPLATERAAAAASHVLDQADGAIDAVVRGDGKTAIPSLLAARDDGLHTLPA
jgi:hypothetical protein